MTNLPSSAFSSRDHIIAYWVTTALLAFELALGGVWDILRVPQIRDLIERLGYPLYFLVILGIWKLLGAVALVIPRFPSTQGVGLRRCAVRFDGRGCVAFCLGVDWCGYDGISDHNDRRCSCILGTPSAIPPAWFRLSYGQTIAVRCPEVSIASPWVSVFDGDDSCIAPMLA